MRNIILVILMLLTTVPSLAATPVSEDCEQTDNGLVWNSSQKQWLHSYVLKCGGGVENYQDGTGSWKTLSLNWQESVIDMGDGTYRLPYGRFGYTADLTNGWIKVHPRINGVIDWDSWMYIGSQSPTPLEVSQYNDQWLEVHKETATICYCFHITPWGFSFEIELLEGYNTNNNSWSFVVSFTGITRVGRKLYYDADGRFLGRMIAPLAFPADFDPDTAPAATVTESIDGTDVTWTVPKATLDGLTFPVKMSRRVVQ